MNLVVGLTDSTIFWNEGRSTRESDKILDTVKGKSKWRRSPTRRLVMLRRTTNEEREESEDDDVVERVLDRLCVTAMDGCFW